MKIRFLVSICLILATAFQFAGAVELPKTPSPEGAEVYFIWPKDGKTVGKTFTVRFGLKGMGVAPAGVDLPNTGHHHLIINMDELPNLNLPLPMNDNVRHFGGGQTEARITLEPGTHTLQLVFADKIHLAHSPAVISEKITITVK
ncbi:MAG: DUF4399 domain-containing protein [Verrucomicrobiota bacterium]